MQFLIIVIIYTTPLSETLIWAPDKSTDGNTCVTKTTNQQTKNNRKNGWIIIKYCMSVQGEHHYLWNLKWRRASKWLQSCFSHCSLSKYNKIHMHTSIFLQHKKEKIKKAQFYVFISDINFRHFFFIRWGRHARTHAEIQ